MKNLFILLLSVTLVACRATSAPTEPEQYPQGNMRIINDRIIVQAQMNDSIPLKLIFDTGYTFGFNLSEEMLRTYMPASFKLPDSGQGEDYRFTAPHITIDSADLRLSSILSLPEQNISLQRAGVDGIFSPNYRSDHRIWELNCEQGYMKLHDSITVPEGALVLPIRFDKYKVELYVQIPMQFINGSDTLRTNYEYLFDTGTPMGFVFVSAPQEVIEFSEKIPHIDTKMNPTVITSSTLMRKFYFDRIVIPEFKTFYDVRSLIHIGETIHIPLTKGVVGTIGMQIFKHFNIFIDLKDNRLILVKHDRVYPNSRGTTSSMGLYFQDDYSTVKLIDIGSPADKAGIAIGDRVISMNGVLNSELGEAGLDSIRLLPAGVPIKMKVERGGREFEVEIETYKGL